MSDNGTCRCVCSRHQCSGEILPPRSLIIAAAQGQRQLIEAHLLAGGHPDATVNGKPTALCYAAMSDDSEMAWLLIKAGAQLDYQDGIGNTACIYAVLTGNDTVLELLLTKGADIALRNKQGKCLIDYAHCTRRNNSLIREVISHHRQTQMESIQQSSPVTLQ